MIRSRQRAKLDELTVTGPNSAGVLIPAKLYVLIVKDAQNRVVARIDARTGEIEFGSGAPVEEQAREFWRILARYAPRDHCPNQGGEPGAGGTKNG